jgi:hypothetical protein
VSHLRQGEGGTGWVRVTFPIAGDSVVDLSSLRIRETIWQFSGLLGESAELQIPVLGSTVAGRLGFLDPCWLPRIVDAVGAPELAVSLIVPVGGARISLVFVGIVLGQMSAF